MKNVLLITIDSLRTDHVGYHGYDRDTTPNIDKYAESGSRFMNCFAHAGGTKMSFPSILSSVYPLMYGGYLSGVSEEQTLVSEVFREEGYDTAGFHSNLFLSDDWGYDRGWDVFFDSKEEMSFMGRLRQYAKSNLRDSFVFPYLERLYGLMESSGGVNVGSFHVPGDELTDMALDYVRDADTDKPRFLWVHYMDVHHPFLPPEEYQLLFRDSVIGERRSIKLRRKMMEEPENVTEEELSDVVDLYDAEIRFTDDEVGRLVEGVREEWGETLVALTADHGEHFVGRGSLSGAHFYDEKTHVPLLINGWGDAGSYDELVGLVDVPPTLLDYAGLEIPSNYYGESLWRLVEEGEWSRTSVIGGLERDPPEYGYRDRDWKYIWRSDGEELYDLGVDPEEQNNVAEENPGVVEELRGEVEDHRRLLGKTDLDSEVVEVGGDVAERLRKLGYKE